MEIPVARPRELPPLYRPIDDMNKVKELAAKDMAWLKRWMEILDKEKLARKKLQTKNLANEKFSKEQLAKERLPKERRLSYWEIG